MTPEFSFIGFVPDSKMKGRASLAVERLLDSAPFGSVVVALLQKDDVAYRCAIEVYSKNGPFVARASAEAPDSALESAMVALLRRLDRRRQSSSGWKNSGSRVPMASVA